jgi:hypothetical protein
LFAFPCRNRYFRYQPTGDNGGQSKLKISLLPAFYSLCCFDFVYFLLQKILFAAENQLTTVLKPGGYGCLQSRLPV